MFMGSIPALNKHLWFQNHLKQTSGIFGYIESKNVGYIESTNKGYVESTNEGYIESTYEGNNESTNEGYHRCSLLINSLINF